MKLTKILSVSALVAAAFGFAACADTDAQYSIPAVDAPVVVSTSPSDGEVIGSAGDLTITVKYDKRVFFSSQRYAEIELTGGTVKSANVYGTDSVLTIVANIPDLGTDCTLTIPEGLVTGPNKMAAPETTISFSTKALPSIATSLVAGTSTEAVALYNYLLSNYKTNIISGMMANVAWNNECSEQVYEWTGKYPALNGYDYIHVPASAQGANWIDYSDITPVKEWSDAGGIVAIGWHWLAPKEEITEEEEAVDVPLTLTSTGTWEGSYNVGTDWGKSATISASDLADVAEGDVLTLYFSQNSDAEYWQAKVMDGNWTALTSYKDQDNGWGCIDTKQGDTSVSFTLNADDATAIKTNGLILSGYGLTYTKMTITGGSSSGSDDANTVAWEGSQNVGTAWDWQLALTVDGSNFSNLSEGDALVISFTENSDATYWQLKTCANLSTGWAVLTSCSGLAEVNSYDCIELASGATSYSLTLNAEDVANIKSTGLVLQGYGVTYTKIAIASSAKVSASFKRLLAKSRTAYSKLDPNTDFSYEKDVFDLDNAVTEGTWENTFVKADLERVANYLKLLKDAGIPVLWRPLHEASGGWFWWGKNATSFKKLWQMMFDYFKEQGLDNLVWVWTSQGDDDDWYPGDNYVDVIGRDLYGSTVATCAEEYQNLIQKYGKIVTLSECGYSSDAGSRIGTIADQWAAGAKWSWFMPWYDGDDTADEAKHANQAWWEAAMQMDNVITRDKVSLK